MTQELICDRCGEILPHSLHRVVSMDTETQKRLVEYICKPCHNFLFEEGHHDPIEEKKILDVHIPGGSI